MTASIELFNSLTEEKKHYKWSIGSFDNKTIQAFDKKGYENPEFSLHCWKHFNNSVWSYWSGTFNRLEKDAFQHICLQIVRCPYLDIFGGWREIKTISTCRKNQMNENIRHFVAWSVYKSSVINWNCFTRHRKHLIESLIMLRVVLRLFGCRESSRMANLRVWEVNMYLCEVCVKSSSSLWAVEVCLFKW